MWRDILESHIMIYSTLSLPFREREDFSVGQIGIKREYFQQNTIETNPIIFFKGVYSYQAKI